MFSWIRTKFYLGLRFCGSRTDACLVAQKAAIPSVPKMLCHFTHSLQCIKVLVPYCPLSLIVAVLVGVPWYYFANLCFSFNE